MTVEEEPPLIFARGADQSTLPVRQAAAVALRRVDGRILLVRRNAEMPEFPGVWSLPSAYERPGLTPLESLKNGLREWLDVDASDWQLHARRMALRPQWRLAMFVYGAASPKEPSLISPKYDRCQWRAADELLPRLTGEHQGDCLLAFKEYWERKGQGRP